MAIINFQYNKRTKTFEFSAMYEGNDAEEKYKQIQEIIDNTENVDFVETSADCSDEGTLTINLEGRCGKSTAMNLKNKLNFLFLA